MPRGYNNDRIAKNFPHPHALHKDLSLREPYTKQLNRELALQRATELRVSNEMRPVLDFTRPHPSHNGSFTDGWYQMAKEGKRPLLEKDSVQHTEFPWPPQLPLQRHDPPKAQGSMDIFMKEDRNFATENRVQLQRKQGRPSTSFKPSDSSVEEVHKQMFLVEPFSYETNMQRSFKQLAFPERETKVPKCKINTLGPAASGGAFWLQKFGNVVSQMKESYSEDSLKANTAPHASESKQALRTAGKFDSQFTTKWDDKLYFHSSYKDTFTTPASGPNVGKGESLRRADTKMQLGEWDPTIKSVYRSYFDDSRFEGKPLREPSRYTNILNDTIKLAKIGHASTPQNLIAKEKAAAALIQPGSMGGRQHESQQTRHQRAAFEGQSHVASELSAAV